MSEIPFKEWAGIRLVHIIVVSLSLMLTLFAWQFSKSQLEQQIAQRFASARDNVTAVVVDRMLKYEDALWGGVAAVESHGGDISYTDWHNYARKLRIEEKYPGINGIGLIHFKNDQTLDSYLAQQRVERPDFRIFPEHDQSIYMPITFIEPEDMNAAAIGLDVAHEQNRRQAALISADTGTAQITGPITLVQDAGATPGFLFYAPVYRHGTPKSQARRSEQIIGLVYAPFVVHKLVSGLLAEEYRNVKFSIEDDQTLIYDEHSAANPLADPDPMYAEQVVIELYGRTWTIDVRTDLNFRNANSLNQSTYILIGGLMIEALIITLLFMLSHANAHAIRYADQVTADLKEESGRLDRTNTELSLKNEELEQFAYVASHDLKTPIRGINGLTEMIEEDLEDYFASPQANQDVQHNLTAIRSRVERMSQLTQGIMSFGQVDGDAQVNDVLALEETLADLTFDLNLEKGQLVLLGDVASIAVDTVNLRRVLENLIGNAVKYHDGVRPMKITVTAHSAGGRCNFEVADNGPGIDAKFHERIFKVFQTLRTENAPESTGIGLAIVKKAVDRHGCTIQVLSTMGLGTTFLFDWPQTEEKAQDSKHEKVA